MDKISITLLFGILLFLIGAINYQKGSFAYSDHYCDNHNQICALCPIFTTANNQYDFNNYAQATFDYHFIAIVSNQRYSFKKVHCKQILNLINHNDLTLKEDTQLKQPLKQQKIKILSSQQIVKEKRHNELVFGNFIDFILIYKWRDNTIPTVKIENHKNLEKILKMANVFAWSVLISLILKSIDTKIGLFSNLEKPHAFPLLQLIISLYLVCICSNDNYFMDSFVGQLMFLAYLIFKIKPNIQKYVMLIGIVVCFFDKRFIIIGEVITMYFLFQTILKQDKKLTILLLSLKIVVIVQFTLKILTILSYNYCAYLSHLWAAIFNSLTLIIFQISQQNIDLLINTSNQIEENDNSNYLK